jgi:hypothetical protein
MARRVFSRFTRISLLTPGERPVEGDLLPLADAFRARSLLEQFLFDSYDMMVLRDIYAEWAGPGSLVHVSDHDIIAALARRISIGELRVVREPEFRPGGGRIERAEPEPELAGPAATETKHWIKIKVVDDRTGNPIAGVKMLVRQPNGFEREYETRPDGMIEVHELDPGTCDARSTLEQAHIDDALDFVARGETPAAAEALATTRLRPGGPLRILEVEYHKVQTGESIASLAAGAGLSWQQLAEFNWDTSVPTKINERLRSEVGCTKKTADGHNYMFDSSDDPGIVFIPREWTATGLATDQTHTIRVKYRTRTIYLYDERRERRLPHYEYLLFSGDRHVHTGESDAEARLDVKSLPRDWWIDVVGPGPSHPVWTEEEPEEAPSEAEADEAEKADAVSAGPEDDEQDPLDEGEGQVGQEDEDEMPGG